MFSLEKAEFRYDPYPIGIVRPVMEPELYETLVESFPPVELFKYMPKFGHKYTLSEKFNPENYHKYIAEHRPWRELHAWIKSEAFFRTVDALLRAHNIDLGLETARFAGQGKWAWRSAWIMLFQAAVGRRRPKSTRLSREFAFWYEAGWDLGECVANTTSLKQFGYSRRGPCHNYRLLEPNDDVQEKADGPFAALAA